MQVVDKDSAVLGYTNEDSIALATDHRGLVRYQGLIDDNFDFVRKTILVKLEDILAAAEADQGIEHLNNPSALDKTDRSRICSYIGVICIQDDTTSKYQDSLAHMEQLVRWYC
jgi:hypothetical protein